METLNSSSKSLDLDMSDVSQIFPAFQFCLFRFTTFNEQFRVLFLIGLDTPQTTPHPHRSPPHRLIRVTMPSSRPSPILGAGKSTLSYHLLTTQSNFTRLSVDALIHSAHGLYNIDHPAYLYAQYQTEASASLRTQLLSLLYSREKDVILDRSFYAKEDRDEFKELIEENGGRWVLVYLDASKEVLWRRILERKKREMDADWAFEVTEEVFERYWSGFERPLGEGEIVVKVV
jgi:predicted kinase